MSGRSAGALGAAILTAAVLVHGVARADAIEDFYKGRPVPIIVSFDAGGAYGLYTQLLAQDIAKSPVQRTVATFMSSSGAIGRSYVLPPKAPDDRLAALRMAFDRMVKDPAMAEAARKAVFGK